MVAAIAITNELPLYTANPDDFTGIEGLDLHVVPTPARADPIRTQRA